MVRAREYLKKISMLMSVKARVLGYLKTHIWRIPDGDFF